MPLLDSVNKELLRKPKEQADIRIRRYLEIFQAFNAQEEIWLSIDDLHMIGVEVFAEDMGKPGHRMNSETGEVCYSADWL